MDSWFLAAVRGGQGNETMVAEDPVRRLCLGRLKNIPAQIICIVLVSIQAVLINHHLVVTSEGADRRYWIWMIADGMVIIAFITGFYFREWRVGRIHVKHKEATNFVKGLPFGSLSWLIYALMLGARIAIIFKNDLEEGGEIADLKLTICASAVICVFFTMSHHHSHESLARRAAILSIMKMFTIDLLDTVDILDILFETAKDHPDTFSKVLEDVVLVVVTLNLLQPAIVLLSLFIDHYTSVTRSLQYKIFKTLMELFMLNIPLLVIRVYIGLTYEDSISVFLVKNILGTLYGLVEIYDCCFDIYAINREKTENTDKSDGEVKAKYTKSTDAEPVTEGVNTVSQPADGSDVKLEEGKTNQIEL